MQSRIRYLVPLLSLALATCSWTTNFVVINGLTESIRITYVAHPLRTPPMVAATKDLADSREDWNELNVSMVRRDSAVLTVPLGPDSALVLAEMGTYTGYRDDLGDWFEVKSLRILTTLGERSYRGREVLRAFARRSDRLYVLELR